MRDSLDHEIVRAALVTSGQPWRAVEFHAALGSTNTRLRDLVSGADRSPGAYAGSTDQEASGLWWVVLTDHQTGGRGRLGRVWEVPDRASVAVSCAVPVADPAVAGWLPLLAGLALSRALRRVTSAAGHELDPRLKWPNDVLLRDDGDRKVGGILSELVRMPGDTAYAVVVGTGVNVDQDRDELPVDTATSLALAGASVAREDVVVGYLRELAELLAADPGNRLGQGRTTVGRPGPDVRSAYVAGCSTVGARVHVHLPGGEVVEGDAVDVDTDGRLVVDTMRGRRSFAAGDVVHVRR